MHASCFTETRLYVSSEKPQGQERGGHIPPGLHALLLAVSGLKLASAEGGIDCLGLVTLQISGIERGMRKLRRSSVNTYFLGLHLCHAWAFPSFPSLGFSHFEVQCSAISAKISPFPKNTKRWLIKKVSIIIPLSLENHENHVSLYQKARGPSPHCFKWPMGIRIQSENAIAGNLQQLNLNLFPCFQKK